MRNDGEKGEEISIDIQTRTNADNLAENSMTSCCLNSPMIPLIIEFVIQKEKKITLKENFTFHIY